jgi:hypothetical protein
MNLAPMIRKTTRQPACETVHTIVKALPGGGGFPSLVETASGGRYVMKLSGVGQGATGLATEFIATRLAALLGLNVPAVTPLWLPEELPWQAGTDEFYDAQRRSSGWNLGVTFLDGAVDLTSKDLSAVPDAFLDRLAAVDALLQNVDRTAKNLNLMRTPDGAHWAIDFGACLFLQRWARRSGAGTCDLPPTHLLAGRAPAALEVDAALASTSAIVAALPEPWVAALAADRASLVKQIVDILRHQTAGERCASDTPLPD